LLASFLFADTEWIKFDAAKGVADWDGPSYGKELYDHNASPTPQPDFNYENVNVVTDPAHADLIKQLAVQLRAGWRAALPPSVIAAATAAN
jgi:hypothetical protein